MRVCLWQGGAEEGQTGSFKVRRPRLVGHQREQPVSLHCWRKGKHRLRLLVSGLSNRAGDTQREHGLILTASGHRVLIKLRRDLPLSLCRPRDPTAVVEHAVRGRYPFLRVVDDLYNVR